MHDELLDIISQDDIVIGTQQRSIVYAQKLSCFRVINAFVINSQGKLWIPRRHKDKKLFPLHLDASVGGHVMAGETYEQAFIRETQEEIGLSLSQADYKPLCKLTPHEHGTSGFMWVYAIFADSVSDYCKTDFTEFYWITPDEFFAKLKAGDKAKSDLPIILKHIKDLLTV